MRQQLTLVTDKAAAWQHGRNGCTHACTHARTHSRTQSPHAPTPRMHARTHARARMHASTHPRTHALTHPPHAHTHSRTHAPTTRHTRHPRQIRPTGSVLLLRYFSFRLIKKMQVRNVLASWFGQRAQPTGALEWHRARTKGLVWIARPDKDQSG